MPAGRPTKYTPELLKLAHAYIDEFQPDETALIPMIAGLAYHLKISRDTVHTWAREKGKEEFSDLVEQIMTKQEQMLFTGGLSGAMNASITKLALTKHGYTDKTESNTKMTLDLKGKTDEELEAIVDGSE